jgi:choice-of-anchor C domain-containing protein
MKFSKTRLAALALAVTAPMASAAPNLITNGSFESNVFGFSGSVSTLSAGSNALTGWTINSGTVDLVNTYWAASQGQYSLDLSGEQDGTISQSFATVVGQTYQVSFDMAGNPTDGDKVKYLQVGLSNLPLYEFDTTGKTHSNMGWTTKTFVFQAVSTSSTLFFAGLQDSPYGVALDNVSVSAVPEPETYALLLAGMGLVGAAARRKSVNASR